ncbi:hypothetical protein [Xenorhabdus anantnagensis]|uniref:Transposase n=1 Tax=Xenorhabdus anantnagensis TaxID=3025875 RepID=A0ABT5LWR7_9GAMM|nr:hypothetical protein [Xenorhabdus anantnagensis]MDC9598649.1 hypothetical protein [Xenorhabdus anantnagensis]
MKMKYQNEIIETPICCEFKLEAVQKVIIHQQRIADVARLLELPCSEWNIDNITASHSIWTH